MAAGTFSVASYQFFASDPYSRANLAITLWTTGVCAVLLLVHVPPDRSLPPVFRYAPIRLCAESRDLSDVRAIDHPQLRLYPRAPGRTERSTFCSMPLASPKIRSPYLTPWGPVIGLVWDNIPLTVLILLSGWAQFPISHRGRA